MEIEDKGELTTFQAMPKEATLYITAAQHSSGQWMGGPSNHDKSALMEQLRQWNGFTRCRIYAVTVPVIGLGA